MNAESHVNVDTVVKQLPLLPKSDGAGITELLGRLGTVQLERGPLNQRFLESLAPLGLIGKPVILTPEWVRVASASWRAVRFPAEILCGGTTPSGWETTRTSIRTPMHAIYMWLWPQLHDLLQEAVPDQNDRDLLQAKLDPTWTTGWHDRSVEHRDSYLDCLFGTCHDTTIDFVVAALLGRQDLTSALRSIIDGWLEGNHLVGSTFDQHPIIIALPP